MHQNSKEASERAIYAFAEPPASSRRQPSSPLRHWLALSHVGINLAVHIPV